MPFQAKPLDLLPRDVTPDVQIIFHGQLILRSEDGQGCDVMVNPFATRHLLTIEARIKKPGATDRIRMRHLGPLNFRDSEAMLIEVLGGAPVVPGAFKLVGNEPINFEQADSAPEDDFRWILNVEGPQFHERVLNTSLFATQNVIRLRGAQYYFKTAARASRRYKYRRRGGNKPDAVMGAIGCVASASVNLDNGQSLVMKWRDGSREEDRTLSLEKSAGTSYEIYVENTPLFLDKPRETDLPRLDEFIQYYKILDVPPAERFSLVPELAEVDGQLGTPEVPCQVVTLDGTGGG